MFDRGLISIADYHELLFARGKVPKQVMSLLKPDRRLLVPAFSLAVERPWSSERTDSHFRDLLTIVREAGARAATRAP